MKVELVWFDSLGAKSSCVFIETPSVKLIIDPGVAIMHPSFPASQVKKLWWKEKGKRMVKRFLRKAEVVIVTHYHYDHYLRESKVYKGKTLLAKSPNEFVNASQRKRATDFYSSLVVELLGRSLEDFLEKRKRRKSYESPLRELRLARRKDFGDYQKRREELLKQGEEWFWKRVEEWKGYEKLSCIDERELKVSWCDGKEFEFGKTTVRFSKPLFHGVEFSRVGWVVAVEVIHKDEKFLFTSDVNGPVIEDYAEWIISRDADFIVVDGPPTYLVPYTLNMVNFRRCLENMKEIIARTNAKVIIYDHHLPREKRFRERTEEVWRLAKASGKKVLTAAEFLGKVPVVLKL